MNLRGAKLPTLADHLAAEESARLADLEAAKAALTATQKAKKRARKEIKKK